MNQLGIGVVGGGYMGKAHSVAFAAVGAVFETTLRPRLVSIAGSSAESSARYARAFGFAKAAADWRALVEDPEVQAVVIATPQALHREIAEAAFALGKHVLCEKPMGRDLAEAQAMLAAAQAAGVVHMVGYNYIRTPASQFARRLIAEGRLGRITGFRGEHHEDFQNDLTGLAPWRCVGAANGCLGDLAPHVFNQALALLGPIETLTARLETVHPTRGDVTVTNDDQLQMMLRFASGASGMISASRVATGRKMGYAYEIFGTKGALRFDQEDQNALWFYEEGQPAAEQGYRRILTGPAHPDYLPFCQGPGHGTGYQDQIIIEAHDFLKAIEGGAAQWPDFSHGVEVHRIMAAVRASDASGGWVNLTDF